MFYVRSKINDDVIPLTESNILTRCPMCGEEHKVNICRVAQTMGENFNLRSARVMCERCSTPGPEAWPNKKRCE